MKRKEIWIGVIIDTNIQKIIVEEGIDYAKEE